jgi:hypothetical protein
VGIFCDRHGSGTMAAPHSLRPIPKSPACPPPAPMRSANPFWRHGWRSLLPALGHLPDVDELLITPGCADLDWRPTPPCWTGPGPRPFPSWSTCYQRRPWAEVTTKRGSSLIAAAPYFDAANYRMHFSQGDPAGLAHAACAGAGRGPVSRCGVGRQIQIGPPGVYQQFIHSGSEPARPAVMIGRIGAKGICTPA